VCVVWTLAFAVKFVASFFGDNIYSLNVTKDTGFLGAAYLALFTMITEIFPLFLVVDGSFVKVFSGEHLEIDDDPDTSLLIGGQDQEIGQSNDTKEKADSQAGKVDFDSDKKSMHPLLNSANGSFVNPK